ncbi:MAG: hypothetical protein FWB85_06525 [Chitinispirillia bacterium]|nr:hypothetical protein [Chitinispirillia bacterium]MCL2241877.1 hypothetical protein [Chitinispirillia bacterium]
MGSKAVPDKLIFAARLIVFPEKLLFPGASTDLYPFVILDSPRSSAAVRIVNTAALPSPNHA